MILVNNAINEETHHYYLRTHPRAMNNARVMMPILQRRTLNVVQITGEKCSLFERYSNTFISCYWWNSYVYVTRNIFKNN